jgi:hypothetical protein
MRENLSHYDAHCPRAAATPSPTEDGNVRPNWQDALKALETTAFAAASSPRLNLLCAGAESRAGQQGRKPPESGGQVCVQRSGEAIR